jgi:hypothetical protein
MIVNGQVYLFGLFRIAFDNLLFSLLTITRFIPKLSLLNITDNMFLCCRLAMLGFTALLITEFYTHTPVFASWPFM